MSTAYATGSVSGTGSQVGGLAGTSSGAINGVWVSGAVFAPSDAGGLLGVMTGGTVTDAYSLGAVTGSGPAVGGLIGYLSSGVRKFTPPATLRERRASSAV